MLRLSLALLWLVGWPAATLAQCPDGTPPPCSRVRSARPNSIAVLDFQNLSRDTGDSFLPEELAEELTARLGQVERLVVAPRLAVRRLRQVSSMGVPEIGRTLNVTYLVTGSIRRSGPRLRVTVELLRAATATQVWTNQYDRSDSDLLALQVALATDLAAGVAGRLLPAERTTLAALPTLNPEAFRAYERGRVLGRRGAVPALSLETLSWYERAVALDSSFAEAWARMARTHMIIYENGVDRSPQRVALARAAADRAVALAPRAAETQMAVGTVAYYGSRDYGRALEAFSAALAVNPNDIEIHNAIANVARRQGSWALSLDMRSRAMELDPGDWLLAGNRADTYRLMRRYSEARADYGRALAQAPDPLFPLHATLVLALSAGDSIDPELAARLAERAEDAAQAGLFGDPLLVFRLATPVQDAILRVGAPATPEARLNHYVAVAEAAEARGLRAEVLAAADSVRAIATQLLSRTPDDYQFLAPLSLAQGRLGRCDDALLSAARASARLPTSADAIDGPTYLLYLARVEVMCGRAEQAIEHLEQLLAIPSGVTLPLLRSDPAWAPLRHHPRFAQLLTRT